MSTASRWRSRYARSRHRASSARNRRRERARRAAVRSAPCRSTPFRSVVANGGPRVTSSASNAACDSGPVEHQVGPYSAIAANGELRLCPVDPYGAETAIDSPTGFRQAGIAPSCRICDKTSTTPQVSAIRPLRKRKIKISLYVTNLPVGGMAMYSPRWVRPEPAKGMSAGAFRSSGARARLPAVRSSGLVGEIAGTAYRRITIVTARDRAWAMARVSQPGLLSRLVG